jgi:2-iminobutanoate/2-iminopropanoate deaminase
VKADKFLFVSGQLPIDPKEDKIVAIDIASQTRQVMENIKTILKASDSTMKDVALTNVYLSSMTLFDQFNSEYAKCFDGEFPARVTLGCELKEGALLRSLQLLSRTKPPAPVKNYKKLGNAMLEQCKAWLHR